MEEFEQLVAQHSNMIHSIIRSLNVYKNQDEFYQVGLLALWEASEKFDEQKGVKFSTYAYSVIRGRLLMFLQNETKWDDRVFYPSEEYWDQLECETSLLEKETLLCYFLHLTDLQKKWVLLHFYEGWTNADIAKGENIKLSTVRGWEREAMKKCLVRHRPC
ncbi:sigma-70 family RNA polymerase sigma factor [Bacillus sp. V3B]|uniref:sigma-70 family RNA polymerase sigma factor n=1 Tax=Bacillus sp. V3B TaxID=2804915 RepID=UPI00210C7E54|nr:sigma-70 family RNA polymerase sigma factor [Bacillus sp. V3B]MCQ6277168.1 sigma-70 family RNA polymerase sigma factor [Bacillus sp. V3B]